MNNNFQHTFLNPFKTEPDDLGFIAADQIVDKFRSINWNDYLKQMSERSDEVETSPTIDFINTNNNHIIAISAVGYETLDCFYVFYIRPEVVSRFMGLSKKEEPKYMTDAEIHTIDECVEILDKFIEEDYEWLAKRINR